MKKTHKYKLRCILLIFNCLCSVLFFINSIKIENSENLDKEIDTCDQFFNNLRLLGTSYDDNYINSLENKQQILISDFIEVNVEKYEIAFYFILSTGSSFLLEVLVLFKNESFKEKSKRSHPLEIEGVRLTEEEMKVFKLIQEYLNDNRVFKKEKVALYIQSRYKANGNLNQNGINLVIDSLINKSLLLENSKLTRMTVLLNTNRKIIYNLIIENPGIYMYKLSKKLKLSPFVTKWHLSMLKKFKLIRESHLNHHISYFKFSMHKENDLLFNIISKDKCKKILCFLNKNKMGYTKNQIAKALHMHYNTITKYLDEIDKFNLLIREKVNNIEYITLNNYYFQKLIY